MKTLISIATVALSANILSETQPTPNIDRMAMEGVRFNNAYATDAVSLAENYPCK